MCPHKLSMHHLYGANESMSLSHFTCTWKDKLKPTNQQCSSFLESQKRRRRLVSQRLQLSNPFRQRGSRSCRWQRNLKRLLLFWQTGAPHLGQARSLSGAAGGKLETRISSWRRCKPCLTLASLGESKERSCGTSLPALETGGIKLFSEWGEMKQFSGNKLDETICWNFWISEFQAFRGGSGFGEIIWR